MALKLDCPRCKTPLLAPDKVAGSYAHCPACRGRVWIPHTAPTVPQVVEQVLVASAGASVGASGSAAMGAAPLPPAPAPIKSAAVLPPAAPPGWTPPAPGHATAGAPVPGAPGPGAPAAAPPAPSAPQPGANAPVPASPRPPSAPPPAPTQRSRGAAPTAATPTTGAAGTLAGAVAAAPGAVATVASAPATISVPPGASPGAAPARTARLITSETAQSALKLAPDGRLPELRLDEDETTKKGDEEQGAAMNPLVLFGLLTLSVAMSVAMVLIDWSTPTTSRAEERGKARAVIEEKFFGGGSLNRTKPLEPYQELLRDAQREHFRGNLLKERDLYRKVLDMIRAERGAGDRGLTGSLTNDRLLEKQLLILLTEG